jgi:drug/metabolite transporter (DMT)-like permease
LPDERPPALLPYALLSLPVFFWGAAYRAMAIAAEHTSGLMMAALRPLPTFLLLVPAFLAGVRLPRGRALRGAALAGLLTVTLFYIGVAEGTAQAGAGNAAVLVSTSPLFVLVLGRLFLGERISPAGAVGLALGFVGVVVIVSSQLGGEHGGNNPALGLGLALMAGVAWAVGTLLVRAAALREPDADLLGITVAQFLFGAPVLFVIAFPLAGIEGTDWSSGEMWGAICFVALGGGGVATAAYFVSLRRLTAAQASSAQFLVPVVAVLIELARGDAPGAIVLAGMVLAVAGVALVVGGDSLLGARGRRLRRGTSVP